MPIDKRVKPQKQNNLVKPILIGVATAIGAFAILSIGAIELVQRDIDRVQSLPPTGQLGPNPPSNYGEVTDKADRTLLEDIEKRTVGYVLYQPGFVVPAGWSGRIDPAEKFKGETTAPDGSYRPPTSATVTLYNTPVIYYCTECDGGPIASVTITAKQKPAGFPADMFTDPIGVANELPKFAAGLKAHYEADPLNKNVVVTGTLFGGPMPHYQVSYTMGTSDGMIEEHPMIDRYVIGKDLLYKVQYDSLAVPIDRKNGQESARLKELETFEGFWYSMDWSKSDILEWWVGQ